MKQSKYMKCIEESKICFGKINYNAYRDAVGGKTWNGENMKEYNDMPEKIQNAWKQSAWQVFCMGQYYADYNCQDMLRELKEDEEEERKNALE